MVMLMLMGRSGPAKTRGSKTRLSRRAKATIDNDIHHHRTPTRLVLPTMAVLRFSLSAEATGRIYELLLCSAKFGESVSIEAKKDKVQPLYDQMEAWLMYESSHSRH